MQNKSKQNQALADIITKKETIKEAAVLGAKDQDNSKKIAEYCTKHSLHHGCKYPSCTPCVQENKSTEEIMLQADIMFCETCMRQNKKWLAKILANPNKETKTRLKTILTDPDNYLRGNIEDYLKEL